MVAFGSKRTVDRVRKLNFCNIYMSQDYFKLRTLYLRLEPKNLRTSSYDDLALSHIFFSGQI